MVLTEPRVFETTCWSLIFSAAGADGDKKRERIAMAELCRVYWHPVFSFVMRRGYSTPEAQDLTQDFFVMILEKNWLGRVDGHRGRFRPFLLKSLQNFLSHAREKSEAAKRGGGVQFVSWDELSEETLAPLPFLPTRLGAMHPEQVFDVHWAAVVVERALHRLREECEDKGRRRLFEILSVNLCSERDDVSYAVLAATLGIAETMVKKQLHNLRQRYRWLLRSEIARTVSKSAEIDDEIRYLCAVLASEGRGAW